MNYQTVRLVSTFGQAAAFPVLGQAQKWKLRPFPVLGLPKSGNCGRVSSFGHEQSHCFYKHENMLRKLANQSLKANGCLKT